MKFKAPANITDYDLQEKMNIFAISYMAEKKGLPITANEGLLSRQKGDVIDINNIARDYMSEFAEKAIIYGFGKPEGLRSDILSNKKLTEMEWMFQWFMPSKFHGDGGGGYNDREYGLQYLGKGESGEGLRLLDDGKWNDKKLQNAFQYLNGKYSSNATPSYENLREHLNTNPHSDDLEMRKS